MNLEQMRARLAEITAKLAEYNSMESFGDAEVQAINDLTDEFDTLRKTVEAKEKVVAASATAANSTRKTSSDTPRVQVSASHIEKNGGFKNFGEYLVAVKKASSGEVDKRFQNTMSTDVSQDGGFLVPEEMIPEVSKRLNSDESLLAKTRQFVISGNNLTINKDEKQPWTGGVTAYWVAEGAPYTGSQGSLSQASFKLNKLGALIQVTDELLEDAVALESYMRGLAPDAIMHKVNEAILNGSGVSKPAGILGSSFRIAVAKESGQTADTIVARNVIKMYARMIPSSRANAVWYINAMCEEQLRTMKDDNGNFIYLAAGSQMNNSPYALLLGRPVIPLLGGIPELGDEGDIIFADLSYYYSIVKAGGMKQAVSSHLLFDRDVQAYKFTLRVDGKVPFTTPVTTQYGAYQMSAFVTLAARA